ncbi:DUF1878 family protein [Gracilibacillus sp. YIM 98692]|uniref:DUF1878 family protein n=1 Tax=Gracilibacillus sp. YIM 98692 TaxID=2663532 RepID=UPI0013D0D2E4|nr:DUF1878 family protein [Gracilibacillus sp. YIM 98692]
MGLEKEVKKQKFHIQLLTSICDMDQYPFIHLLFQQDITEQEYNELMNILAELYDRFLEYQEEGFMNYEKLLIHFVGQLSPKLDPEKTMQALIKEERYIEMVNELLLLHYKYQKGDHF